MPGILDRIRQQLGKGVVDPNVPVDQVAPTLWSKIQQRVKKLFGGGTEEAMPAEPTVLDDQTKRLMLRESGMLRVLVLLSYAKTGSQWRYCEFYSFRPNQKTGALDAFLFCKLHDEIHRMYVSRINGLRITDEPYRPRWPVEI